MFFNLSADFKAPFLNRDAGPSPIQAWMRDHNWLPVWTVVLYLLFIAYGRATAAARRVTPGGRWDQAYFGWNLALSLFSFLGASVMLRILYRLLTTHGFHYTVCTVPWWDARVDPTLTFSTGVFILSKFPELIDTVFLVYQRKPVRVIHWFHHATVLLYCWHAYVNPTPSGIWFATMNYTVHAVMYFYYGFKLSQKPIQMGITVIQITQMIVGTGITVYTAIAYAMGACTTDPWNFGFALGIYSAYLVLFVQLFQRNYGGGVKTPPAPPLGEYLPPMTGIKRA